MRTLLDWLLFPLLAFVPVTLAIRFAAPDPTTPELVRNRFEDMSLLFVLIILSYTAIALLERARPHRPGWLVSQGDVPADTLHLLLTGPVAGPLGLLMASCLVFLLHPWWPVTPGSGPWPSHWPAALQVALALVLAEFGHYWFHRLSHQHPWVWRLHAVHHSAPRLYWLNATRFHPLDLLSLSACQSLPLVLLGIPPRTFFLYTVFASCYGQLQHGNIALRTAGFDWLFSTPLLHRWHHSVDPREGNTNYGAIVNLWDLLFGTYRRPASGEFTGAIGVQGMPRFPRDYGSHLLVPWRWDHVPRDR